MQLGSYRNGRIVLSQVYCEDLTETSNYKWMPIHLKLCIALLH